MPDPTITQSYTVDAACSRVACRFVWERYGVNAVDEKSVKTDTHSSSRIVLVIISMAPCSFLKVS